MKLILFLVAIYSLIFYQHYKIKKSNAFAVVSKKYIKKEIPEQRPVFADQGREGMSNIYLQSGYSGKWEPLTMEFAVRQ